MDLSFYDQGPGVALYIRIFTLILGNTTFALKLAALFASAIALLFIYMINLELSLPKLQFMLIFWMAFLLPSFFSGSLLIMHDSPLLLFWTMALYFTIRYIHRQENWTLYLVFLSLGLGALSKHSMVFFAISLILWLVITPNEYKILKNKHFYAGLILAFLIISPVLYWNIHHDWDNIDAIIHLRSAGGQNFEGASTDKYIIGQIIGLSPLWAFALLILFLWKLLDISTTLNIRKQTMLNARRQTTLNVRKQTTIHSQSITERNSIRFLVINALILPIFFFYMSFSSIIQPNWTFPSYPAIILLLGIYFPITKPFSWSEKIYRLLVFAGFILVLVVNTFVFFPKYITSFLEQSSIDSINPMERYTGYRETIMEIEEFRKKNHPNAKLIANKYQDAAMASWYLPQKSFVGSMNILQKNQYSYWEPMKQGNDYLVFFIQENICEKSFVFFQPLLDLMFEQMVEYPEKEVVVNGKVVKRYQMWYGKNYQTNWAEIFFEIFNNQLLFIHSQGLYQETKMPNQRSHDLLVKAVKDFILRKGKVNCSAF
ncbi:MAG: glycosyltransferase family 39 protein [Leptospiraceae bacterium]|nr:glycosyltransferase family 39 protein [Leptospiraceae bacterium]